jgi:flagellar hook-associated protein 2
MSATSSSSSIDLSSLLQAATGASSSGIDVTSAVDAAVYAAQAPERQWQAQQSTISSQITALTSIQTALSSLSNDLDDLNNISGSLAARTVSSSSSNQVNATASAGAAVGTHLVTVQNLAASVSWYSPSIPSSTSALGTSTLTITNSGGAQSTFTTGSGVNSLTDLVSEINSSSAGVTASIITDANGSRLALVSSTTGSAADFSASYGSTGTSAWSSASLASASTPLSAGSFQIGDGTSTANITVNAGDTLSTVASDINAQGLGLSASVITDPSGAHLQITAGGSGSVSISTDPAFGMTRASTAANASLTVDGIPMSSSSNTVSGALSGLTLNLTGTVAAGNPVTLSVGADTTQIGNALSTFVSDYNSALSLVSAQFTYSTSSGSQGVLSGDSTMRSLQSALLGIGSYSAASDGSSSIQSLANLGVTMNDDGSLTLDTSTLNTAMADPSAVQTFFQGTALNGFAQQFSSDISAFNNPANGSITNEIGNLNQQYTDLQSQVNDYESGYIASQRTVLTAMYSQAEIALQELPAQMQEIQNELGNNSSNS